MATASECANHSEHSNGSLWAECMVLCRYALRGLPKASYSDFPHRPCGLDSAQALDSRDFGLVIVGITDICVRDLRRRAARHSKFAASTVYIFSGAVIPKISSVVTNCSRTSAVTCNRNARFSGSTSFKM